MSSEPEPRFAVVSSYAANWVLHQIPPHVWRQATDGALLAGRPEFQRELVRARRQLAAAAQEWLRPSLASASGSAEAARAEVGEESAVSSLDWVDSATAADQLGVGLRRVRQLLDGGRLSGLRVGGRWRIDAESVRMALNDRKACDE